MGRKISKYVRLGMALALVGGGLLGSPGLVDAEAASPGASTGPAHLRGSDQLTGSSWQLSAVIEDGELSTELPVESSLTFGDEGELSVRPGCNIGSGSVAVYDGFLVVTGLVTTLMACSPPIMELERQVLSTLRGLAFYHTDGERLVLLDARRVLLYEAAS